MLLDWHPLADSDEGGEYMRRDDEWIEESVFHVPEIDVDGRYLTTRLPTHGVVVTTILIDYSPGVYQPGCSLVRDIHTGALRHSFAQPSAPVEWDLVAAHNALVQSITCGRIMVSPRPRLRLVRADRGARQGEA